MRALFGPAGNSQAFADAGYKGNNQAPEFVSRCGLDAYEYQCGRGVRVNPDAASVFAENAKKYGFKKFFCCSVKFVHSHRNKTALSTGISINDITSS